jgi:hypothetical protein
VSLLSCISSSSSVGPTFQLKTHIAYIWTTIGTGQFLQLNDTVVEVKGDASVLGINYPFDIIVTDGSNGQPILTVNGMPDTGATLNGCTVQAHSTLGGMAVTFTTYEGINTELELPDLYPNIFINPS